jgi:acylphosphatase
MPTIHLLIKGKVQGVSYRVSARETAERLSLTGWVKNTAEGQVEAMATGNEEALQQFISWCKKGPPGAKVTEVLVNPVGETPFTRFSITRE